MKGAHRIIVETSKIKYDFVIKENKYDKTGGNRGVFEKKHKKCCIRVILHYIEVV